MRAGPGASTVGRMHRLPRRLRELPSIEVDRLVTAVVLVLTEAGVTAQVLLGDTPDAPLAFVCGTIIASTVLWRRTRPVAAIAVAFAAQFAGNALGGRTWDVTATLLAALLLAYSLGRHAGGRRELTAGLVVLTAGFAVNAQFADDSYLNEIAFDLVVVSALPVIAGLVLRRRSELIDQLRRQRARLERERDDRVRDAAVAERVRIARELHDVVVHDVTAMVVQAVAAREIVLTQPGDAVAAIARVEGAGREALNELRRALGVLRTDDRAMALEPQPTLARLPILIGRARAAGARVELALEPSLGALPADLQLAAYRIVEDVLADLEGRATVRVARDGAALLVEIAHDGAPRDGAELTATRQRVALFDGRLDIAPGREGGSRVCARLPLPISRG
jgi:signal transduction histidine kinase